MNIRRELAGGTKQVLDDLVETLFAQIVIALGEDGTGRTGGMIRIRYAFDPDQGLWGWHEIYNRRIGVRPEGWAKVEDTSQEKAHRLMKHYAHNRFYVSSFQSRNGQLWEYGGGFIIAADVPDLGGWVMLLVSFSGLPEKGDEAFGMALVREMIWNNQMEAYTRILQHNPDNQFVFDFLQAVTT